MNVWLELVLSLPTENATARMRAWRALKSSGAAVLRDGVYLLPQRDACRALLEGVADDVRAAGGAAYLLRVSGDGDGDGDGPDADNGVDSNFVALFDRSADYAAVLADIAAARDELNASSAHYTIKQTRKLAKALANLVETDFFPGEARRQTEGALADLEALAHRALSPHEPSAVARAIPRLVAADFRGRVWATRRRPWADRLACAWLIRRHIDPQARFLWLNEPANCPPEALGFDFDGATFSHVGAKVSFEVLLESFDLEQPALKRLGALVHFLDAGGVEPPEAIGIERVLAGLLEAITDDDQLMLVASGVFEGLRVAFETGAPSPSA
jgi:hypothetical protein